MREALGLKIDFCWQASQRQSSLCGYMEISYKVNQSGQNEDVADCHHAISEKSVICSGGRLARGMANNLGNV